MTVLKATFHTNDEQGPVEIKLTWWKQLPRVYPGLAGYVVTENGTTIWTGTSHAMSVEYALRLYKRYEKESHERATAQSKTP